MTTTLFDSEVLFITLLHPSQHTQHDPLGVNDWSPDFVHESEGFLDSVFKLLNSPQVSHGVIQTLLTHPRASQTWENLMCLSPAVKTTGNIKSKVWEIFTE